MSLKDTVLEVAANPKVATTVATVTSGTGASTAFEWIPNDIGKFVSLLGLFATVIVVGATLAKWRRDNLEAEIFRRQLEKRQDENSGS